MCPVTDLVSLIGIANSVHEVAVTAGSAAIDSCKRRRVSSHRVEAGGSHDDTSCINNVL